MSIRVIHTADVHLGARPDREFPWGRTRGDEIRESFRRLIRFAAVQKPDFLLISGDLFHRPPLPGELREVSYLFSTIPDTYVVLMAGNHDPLGENPDPAAPQKRFSDGDSSVRWGAGNNAYLRQEWPENVIPLFGRTVEKVSVPEKDTAVYGCSYYSKTCRENLYADAYPSGAERHHILLVHGGDAEHSPFDAVKLAGRGFDYIACGHIHKPGLLVRGRAAYCGALEPIDRNDTGPHGFLFVEISEDRKCSIRLVPFAKRSYLELDYELGQETSQAGLEDRIRSDIEKEGVENLYTIRLSGKTDLKIREERLKSLGNIAGLENNLRATYDYAELKERYRGTMIGEYIEALENSRDPAAERALEIGLDAFFGD